ncbi:hypothetical protein MKZ38_003577 [Zalerion maritima]|uniref:Uncharacterized protein n=1 Tax=Zalerion maritima TaxID=339359 RepID=A0AAD5RMK6_9PEZI|nr:hypothetical protein MKZ38_003577 [Zalerion maritima]
MATSPELLPVTLPPPPPPPPPTQPIPSLIQGPLDPPLVDLTLSQVLNLQCKHFSTNEFLTIPWTGTRWSFSHLNQQSSLLAKSMVEDYGIGPGDRVGIMAGNCEQYVAVLFATVRVGGVLVILNNTYTTEEAGYGLGFTECKVFFTTPRISRHDNRPLLDMLATPSETETLRPAVVILRGSPNIRGRIYRTYSDLVASGNKSRVSLSGMEGKVLSHDVCNLQFTSGTTGHPKAAMLTHYNLVNNARFIASRMNLSPSDTLCCPPPLFHCFGLVLGLLACLVSGARIVYPGETFDAPATLAAISDEKCTALHGVPTMIDTLFSLMPSSVTSPAPSSPPCSPPASGGRTTNKPLSSANASRSPLFARHGRPWTSHLRTGIIAGAPVPPSLTSKLFSLLRMTEFTSSYGLTEASPTVFNSFVDDPLALRLSTVGTLMPHAKAKIISPSTGAVVPLGQRGELCVSGYQLQAGYWNNSAKTAEVMRWDAEGVLWLHTGDEAVFEMGENGGVYGRITGRFKDIVIKGGENVYPAEIEGRLLQHPRVERAIVVGVKDQRYGEVVGAFLEKDADERRGDGRDVSDDEVREWVRRKLGRHKAPTYVFWLGESGVPRDVPLTGSGKVKKYEMAKLAEAIVNGKGAAKL